MIKDLIRSIMRENAVESEEELMADNANSDIRDAFIGEDGEFDDTTDVTDAKIKDLIKNLPESNSNITSEEISELSESYLDVFEDSDYALESSVSIDSKITKCESVIESLDYKDSLTENEQQELKQAKRQLSVLTMVKESQSEDLDMDTLDDSDTVDVDESSDIDTEFPEKDKLNEEEGNDMTLDITEGLDDFDINLEADGTDYISDESEDNDDVLESYYEGEVTLALEGARMRYLEELEKKQKALKVEINRLEKMSSMATGERKKSIDEKISKLENEYKGIGKKANEYAGANAYDVGKQKEYAKTAGAKYKYYEDQEKASKKFKEDFGGPQRGKYDPPVSRYKESGTGPDKKQSHTQADFEREAKRNTKESFIIDGEEVLFEESLYADNEPIHDKYNPKKDGSDGVDGKDKYADDQWINDVGVDEGDEVDLSDLDPDAEIESACGENK